MLTSFISKISFATAVVTLVYCSGNDVSFGESIFRAVTVFIGFYCVLVVFFVLLRVVLNPKPGKE
jgi:hypothetical protein